MASEINGKLTNYFHANLPATVPATTRLTNMLAQWLAQQVNKSLIASISVANPGVVTTAANHGFLAGQTVTIAGTTTTPNVNGTQTVGAVTATTFELSGVNVTSGQAGAAGSAASVAATMPNATLLFTQALKQAAAS